MQAAARAAGRWAGTYLMSDEALGPALDAAYGASGGGPAVAGMLCAVRYWLRIVAVMGRTCYMPRWTR